MQARLPLLHLRANPARALPQRPVDNDLLQKEQQLGLCDRDAVWKLLLNAERLGDVSSVIEAPPKRNAGAGPTLYSSCFGV